MNIDYNIKIDLRLFPLDVYKWKLNAWWSAVQHESVDNEGNPRDQNFNGGYNNFENFSVAIVFFCFNQGALSHDLWKNQKFICLNALVIEEVTFDNQLPYFSISLNNWIIFTLYFVCSENLRNLSMDIINMTSAPIS